VTKKQKSNSWNRGLTKETDERIRRYSYLMRMIWRTPEHREKHTQNIISNWIERERERKNK
jgi:hypothetical protein